MVVVHGYALYWVLLRLTEFYWVFVFFFGVDVIFFGRSGGKRENSALKIARNRMENGSSITTTDDNKRDLFLYFFLHEIKTDLMLIWYRLVGRTVREELIKKKNHNYFAVPGIRVKRKSTASFFFSLAAQFLNGNREILFISFFFFFFFA